MTTFVHRIPAQAFTEAGQRWLGCGGARTNPKCGACHSRCRPFGIRPGPHALMCGPAGDSLLLTLLVVELGRRLESAGTGSFVLLPMLPTIAAHVLVLVLHAARSGTAPLVPLLLPTLEQRLLPSMLLLLDNLVLASLLLPVLMNLLEDQADLPMLE